MNENPYASYPSYQDEMRGPVDGPSRLSIPAVLSLVAGLLCCLPGLGILATLLGLLGALSISRSEGRLGGMPAAVIGMALGVLSTVGWVAVAMGAGSAANMWLVNVTGPMSRFVQASFEGDVDAARAELTIGAAGQVTDDEIIRFGQALRAEFGDFVGPPTDGIELIEGVVEGFVRAQNNTAGSSTEAVPSTLYFDAGAVAIFGVIDPGSGGQPSQVFRYSDFLVLLPNSEALVMRDDGPAAVEAIRLRFTPVTSTELLERQLQSAPGAAPESPALPEGGDDEPE